MSVFGGKADMRTITSAEVSQIMVVARHQGDLVYVNGHGSRKATFVRRAKVEDFANDQIDDGIQTTT